MSDYYYELTISSTDFDDIVWIRELVAEGYHRIEAENIITRCEHGTNILGDDSSEACQDCID